MQTQASPIIVEMMAIQFTARVQAQHRDPLASVNIAEVRWSNGQRTSVIRALEVIDSADATDDAMYESPVLGRFEGECFPCPKRHACFISIRQPARSCSKVGRDGSRCEFPKLVSHDVLCYGNIMVNLPIMYLKLQADEVWKNRS